MKKYDLIKLLSVIALTFTLSACNKKDTSDNTNEVNTQAQHEVKTQAVKENIETKKEEIKQAVKDKIETKKEEIKQAVKEENKTEDMQVNLGACKGCHGANFEVRALGKSKIVADMTKDEVSNALIGYKEGTYGGSMKGVMKGQVAKYSNDALQNTGLGK